MNFHKVSVSNTLVTTYRWSIDCCVTFVVGSDELRRVCVMGAGSKSPHRRAGCNACVLEDETWRCWLVDCPRFAFWRSNSNNTLLVPMLTGVYHIWYFTGTVIDYRNWHLSLGRRFRSLKLWFVLRSFGVEGFRTYIRRVRVSPFLIPSSPFLIPSRLF